VPRGRCYSLGVRVVLLGYGNVGKAFARLLKEKRSAYPFPIVGIHTANHGTAFHFKGLDVEPEFGPKVSSADEFLERAKPDVAIEITSLNAATGAPRRGRWSVKACYASGRHTPARS
jgi:homoserine dehydrogenase